MLGADGALAVARASDGAIPAVRALEHDVWLREGGLLRVSTSQAQDAILDRSVDVARELGVEEEAPALDGGAAARCSSPAFRAASSTATAPPSTRRGSSARSAGGARRRRPLARADGGLARIGDGVGDAARGRPRFRGRRRDERLGGRLAALSRLLTPFGSYVVLTEPVPELLAEIGWTGGEAITDCRMFLHYFRTTADGRVLMGSARGRSAFAAGSTSASAPTVADGRAGRGGLRLLLPGLAARRWSTRGGPIDVSADHLPVFGTVPGTRVHYGAGYTGNGVGPSWLGGQISPRS